MLVWNFFLAFTDTVKFPCKYEGTECGELILNYLFCTQLQVAFKNIDIKRVEQQQSQYKSKWNSNYM